MAVARIQGRDIQFDALTRDKVDSPTTENVPSQLVSVVALTQANIKSTVIEDGIYKLAEICTPKLEDECAALGLK
jgi:D-xylose transport system substrate-binding protein